MAKKETAGKKKSEEAVVEAPAPAKAAAPPAAPARTHNTKSVKIPKLAPKNKSRLPRKQKKAMQKAAKLG